MFKAPTSVESTTSRESRLAHIKAELHDQLIKAIDFAAIRSLDKERLRAELRAGVERLCSNQPDLISQAERQRLMSDLVNETLGLGPLEPLLLDPSISDILVNGPSAVFIERHGQLELTNITFDSDDHLLHVIQRIATRVGRRIDESSPMVDARLPDGSRVNAVIRPLALDGALMSIRRFANRPLATDELIEKGTATQPMIDFLRSCVKSRLNLLISGGTGSGKTTLLNLLSSFIPGEQRVVTIEDAAELALQQPHVARMETRPPNLEGRGQVTARELLANALRMRPDRIVVGECRGGEAFDMLQAMNTGHDGSLTTIHANSAEDAVDRLKILVGLAGTELPMWLIDKQIASGIQLVVHVARLAGGDRKIVQISEVIGLRRNKITLQDIFRFEQTGVDAQGRAEGMFVRYPVKLHCLGRLKAHGHWTTLDADANDNCSLSDVIS
jgi:pilus assembly protein CpaF